MESLWKQFQFALKNYNETTEERKLAFENLKSKDEKSAKEIDTQMKKLQKIQVKTELVQTGCTLLLVISFWLIVGKILKCFRFLPSNYFYWLNDFLHCFDIKAKILNH